MLTVLLLCSAPTAKPKAIKSKMNTVINTNLEAMDTQLHNPSRSTFLSLSGNLLSFLFLPSLSLYNKTITPCRLQVLKKQNSRDLTNGKERHNEWLKMGTSLQLWNSQNAHQATKSSSIKGLLPVPLFLELVAPNKGVGA